MSQNASKKPAGDPRHSSIAKGPIEKLHKEMFRPEPGAINNSFRLPQNLLIDRGIEFYSSSVCFDVTTPLRSLIRSKP